MKKRMMMKIIVTIITMKAIVHRNNYKNKKKPNSLTTKKEKRERDREETKVMETDCLKNLFQPKAFVRVCHCVLANFFFSVSTKGNSKLYKIPTNTYRC